VRVLRAWTDRYWWIPFLLLPLYAGAGVLAEGAALLPLPGLDVALLWWPSFAMAGGVVLVLRLAAMALGDEHPWDADPPGDTPPAPTTRRRAWRAGARG
jgi:hypothetical protein